VRLSFQGANSVKHLNIRPVKDLTYKYYFLAQVEEPAPTCDAAQVLGLLPHEAGHVSAQ
jgi:hypothetical protein